MSDTTDRISEENSKKVHVNTKYHSDKIEIDDKVKGYIDELDRLHSELNSKKVFIHNRKGEIIKEFAEFLKSKGIIPNMIASMITQKFKGRINRSYIQEILSGEYKRVYNKNIEQNTSRYAGNQHIGGNKVLEQSSTDENKEPMAMTTDGQIVRNDEQTTSTPNLDDIHEGKSFEQMKRENEITAAAATRQRAEEEIREDGEETLENPRNSVPLLSANSPEVREKLARFDEMEQMVSQMAEDRDAAIEKEKITSSKYNQLKGGSMAEELRRLKVEYNNLKTIMSDVDKVTLAKEGYKEIEVFKLHQDTIRMLQEVSSKSERTFFLLVHPKTMQIKAAKTDKEMHRIQALRNVGAI